MRREFNRHKTAINRGGLSRPIRLALESQLVAPSHRVFDYGCGRGDDLGYLKQLGYVAEGVSVTPSASSRCALGVACCRDDKIRIGAGEVGADRSRAAGNGQAKCLHGGA